MKNRKQLPVFGYLENKNVDIQALLDYCKSEGLLDTDLYKDVNVTEKGVATKSSYTDFIIVNHNTKESFFKEDEAQFLEGEKYKQLYLTEFEYDGEVEKPEIKKANIFERSRRLNPNDPKYSPIADERNYGKRNDLVKGEIEKIFNMFSGKLARVRFAYLAPGFKVKPHIDYDTTYLVRYHLPIITNEKCTVNALRGSEHHQIHFPADGKIYFLNTGLKHWVENNSDEPRIHIIFDAIDQSDLESLVPIC